MTTAATHGDRSARSAAQTRSSRLGVETSSDLSSSAVPSGPRCKSAGAYGQHRSPIQTIWLALRARAAPIARRARYISSSSGGYHGG